MQIDAGDGVARSREAADRSRAGQSHPPRPHLLVLTSTFPRWRGDTEPPFVYELSRRLTDRFEVTVLAPRALGSRGAEEMDGLRVRRFPYFLRRWEHLATHGGGILGRLRANPFNALLVPPFLIGQLVALVRLLRAEPFDLIHAHWLVPQGLAALLGCRLAARPVPIVMTSHGADLFALRGALFARLKRWVIGASRHLTVVSTAMRARAMALGADPERVTVIPMGVDLRTRFIPPPGPRAGAQGQPPEVLFAGRLVEKKGLGVLIAALPELLRRYPDLRLTVAGRGPLESRLQGLAAELGVLSQCRFLGMVGQDRLVELMQGATLLAAPFVIDRGGDQEGLGLVSVEAAGCECPVVAGAVPAVRDVIEDGVTGVLVPPGDVHRLAMAIDGLLADPGRRADLARAARRYCVAHFDWDGIACRYGELLLRETVR